MQQHPLPGCTILKVLIGLAVFCQESVSACSRESKVGVGGYYKPPAVHTAIGTCPLFSKSLLTQHGTAVLNNNMQDKHNTQTHS